MKYSVTTVTLPHLDMVEQCKLLKKLGFDGMELRVRPCTDEMRKQAIPSKWGYHRNDVTPENFKEKAPEIKKVLDDFMGDIETWDRAEAALKKILVERRRVLYIVPLKALASEKRDDFDRFSHLGIS